MQSNHLKRAVLTMAIGCLLAAPPVLAAPGDPLGGDDTGCAPSTKIGLLCGKKVLAVLVKLQQSIVKCHLTLAGSVFQTGHSTNGFSNSEDNCSTGPSNTSAKAKFDAKIASLAANGCDATVIANANAAAAIILGDQSVAGSQDALLGTFFCDTTSGEQLDPGGDDAGYMPNTPENYKCSVGIAKAWVKLVKGLYTCHSKLSASVFKGSVFDEDFCEDSDPIKSKLGKYNTFVNKLITAGICPACLTDPGPTNALDLGTSTVASADANLQDVYICPGP